MLKKNSQKKLRFQEQSDVQESELRVQNADGNYCHDMTTSRKRRQVL